MKSITGFLIFLMFICCSSIGLAEVIDGIRFDPTIYAPPGPDFPEKIIKYVEYKRAGKTFIVTDIGIYTLGVDFFYRKKAKTFYIPCEWIGNDSPSCLEVLDFRIVGDIAEVIMVSSWEIYFLARIDIISHSILSLKKTSLKNF